jgi:hypothetical protein
VIDFFAFNSGLELLERHRYNFNIFACIQVLPLRFDSGFSQVKETPIAQDGRLRIAFA